MVLKKKIRGKLDRKIVADSEVFVKKKRRRKKVLELEKVVKFVKEVVVVVVETEKKFVLKMVRKVLAKKIVFVFAVLAFVFVKNEPMDE